MKYYWYELEFGLDKSRGRECEVDYNNDIDPDFVDVTSYSMYAESIISIDEARKTVYNKCIELKKNCDKAIELIEKELSQNN